MSRKDTLHETVKAALQSAGWHVTDDPLTLRFRNVRLYVDLGAELIAAERNTERIAVEIKTFAGASSVHDLYEALGQYIVYRRALSERQPERTLFLGVSAVVYEDFFRLPFAEAALEDSRVNLLVVNIDTKEVAQWIRNDTTKS
jgi:XisH protein